jgi:hypothetical protein
MRPGYPGRNFLPNTQNYLLVPGAAMILGGPEAARSQGLVLIDKTRSKTNMALTQDAAAANG